MRTETILRICNALHITPDEVLTEESTSLTAQQAELWERLNACNPKDKETALQLLSVFLKSLESCVLFCKTSRKKEQSQSRYSARHGTGGTFRRRRKREKALETWRFECFIR